MNIFPAKSQKQVEKKKGITLSQRYQKYLTKEVEEYNSHDLVFYFSDVYKKSRGISHFINMSEDAPKMKRLKSGLDNYTIVKLIDYVIENKKSIGIGMLCSTWVNSFITEAGIIHPEFTKYEVIISSPFLTKAERKVADGFFDKLVWTSDNGDVHGEVYWKNKLEGVCEEVQRRKELLTNPIEEDGHIAIGEDEHTIGG